LEIETEGLYFQWTKQLNRKFFREGDPKEKKDESQPRQPYEGLTGLLQ